MIPPSRPGLPRPVRAAFALALGAYLAATAWLVWRTSILEPYSDMFDWLERWRRFQADGELWRYLWTPHNFHHLVWTLGILAVDIRWFGASSYLFLAVGVACLAGLAAMLAWIAAKAAGPGLRLIGAGGAAALSTMGCHVLEANIDINTTYLHALVFAVAAVLLAEGPGAPSLPRRTGAIACAAAAGLGSAAGLAVWPALMFAAWRSGRRGWLLTVTAAAVVYAMVYVLGQSPPGRAGGAPQASVQLADALILTVNYLGLPWSRGIPVVGWIVGLAVLTTALAAVVFKGGREAAPTERAAVALVVFSLATAAMAGAARAGVIAPDSAPIRYAVFLIPLHVGLWGLALPYLRRAWARRPQAMAGCVVAAAAAMLAHQALMASYAIRTADADLRAIAAFQAGKREAGMQVTIYPDLAKAEAVSVGLRREGLYQRELRAVPSPSR